MGTLHEATAKARNKESKPLIPPVCFNWTTNNWVKTDGSNKAIHVGDVNAKGEQKYPIMHIGHDSTDEYDVRGVISGKEVSLIHDSDESGEEEDNIWEGEDNAQKQQLKLISKALRLYYTAFRKYRTITISNYHTNMALKRKLEEADLVARQVSAGHMVTLHPDCLECTNFSSPVLVFCQQCRKALHMGCVAFPERRIWSDVQGFTCSTCVERLGMDTAPAPHMFTTNLTAERLDTFSLEQLREEVQSQMQSAGIQQDTSGNTREKKKQWLMNVEGLVVESRVVVSRTAPDVIVEEPVKATAESCTPTSKRKKTKHKKATA
mmetsp:Transcript_41415/g.71304  ORF Transcript_41415/g.71304 Transcript_41415/m.71304 type:complete len:321 (+) Transcript_41415:448-1410(+)